MSFMKINANTKYHNYHGNFLINTFLGVQPYIKFFYTKLHQFI